MKPSSDPQGPPSGPSICDDGRPCTGASEREVYFAARPPGISSGLNRAGGRHAIPGGSQDATSPRWGCRPAKNLRREVAGTRRITAGVASRTLKRTVVAGCGLVPSQSGRGSWGREHRMRSIGGESATAPPSRAGIGGLGSGYPGRCRLPLHPLSGTFLDFKM